LNIYFGGVFGFSTSIYSTTGEDSSTIGEGEISYSDI